MGRTFLLLFFVVALSGCLGGSKGSPESVPEGPTTGILEGVVTDDEFIPLKGVRVEVKTVRFSPIKLESTTKEDGGYRIEAVAAGPQLVSAHLDGYLDAEESIVVPAGQTLAKNLTLRALPTTNYRIVPLQSFQGSYQCAGEWLVGGGSCDEEVKQRIGQSVLQTDNNDTLIIPAGWDGLLVEVEWNASQGASTIEGARFEAAAANGTGTWASVEGRGDVLRIAINRGNVHPGASLHDPIPAAGATTYLHGYPVGKLEGATCAASCLRGVGVDLAFRYAAHVTLFFGGPVKEGYSALAD